MPGNTMATPSGQRGVVMLTAVILLLILVTLVTVSTGRIKSFEHSIMLNAQNYQLAFSSAEAGLAHGFGLLSESPSWDGTAVNRQLPGQGEFTVSGLRQNVIRDSSTLRLVTLTSVGRSPDDTATVTLTQQAIQYSIIANPPDVPLIVAGGLKVGGSFEVAANPNGGGEGVPLSIWTDMDVDMNNGSGATCGLQEFSDGNCSSSPYSEKGFQGSDILDNDANFPDDLMEYLFNIPEDDWPLLRSDADQLYTDCSSLGPNSMGLIWIDGDCSINANNVIGSISDPIVLIVTDGDLTMNGGATINGMVFSFRKPATTTDFDLHMIGGARVNGIVASNHPVGHANGTYNSVYDAEVLESLEQGDAFQRVAIVPGSWRDF